MAEPTETNVEEERNPEMEAQLEALFKALLEAHIGSEIRSLGHKLRNRITRIPMGSQWFKTKTFTEGEESGEEIVIKDQEIKVLYSYPLKVQHVHTHKTENPEGFTRKELYEQIAAHYHTIYDEEEAAVGPTGTITPNMYNRATSNGPHGIWGHYLSDLTLEDVYATEEGIYDMDISS